MRVRASVHVKRDLPEGIGFSVDPAIVRGLPNWKHQTMAVYKILKERPYPSLPSCHQTKDLPVEYTVDFQDFVTLAEASAMLTSNFDTIENSAECIDVFFHVSEVPLDLEALELANGDIRITYSRWTFWEFELLSEKPLFIGIFPT